MTLSKAAVFRQSNLLKRAGSQHLWGVKSFISAAGSRRWLTAPITGLLSSPRETKKHNQFFSVGYIISLLITILHVMNKNP